MEMKAWVLVPGERVAGKNRADKAQQVSGLQDEIRKLRQEPKS